MAGLGHDRRGSKERIDQLGVLALTAQRRGWAEDDRRR